MSIFLLPIIVVKKAVFGAIMGLRPEFVLKMEWSIYVLLSEWRGQFYPVIAIKRVNHVHNGLIKTVLL
jgi:hypothetical protein